MSETIAALRAFLLSVLPAGVEVVRAQDNQVPQPLAADFVVMTIIGRARLATNAVTYSDGGPGLAQERHAKQPTQVTVQLDIHGPESSNTVQIISTLFRDGYGCDKFTASGFDVQPLFCSDPRQAPFVNESQQVESRWTIDAVMQANPVVTSPQEFAADLRFSPVGAVKEVDAEFPPA
ncbi:MAG TPA: hypothetical protein PK861_01205 [Thermomonas sp.]|nr:hypothetical protein [Thermomonas sp.]